MRIDETKIFLVCKGMLMSDEAGARGIGEVVRIGQVHGREDEKD